MKKIPCGDAQIEPDYRLGVGIWSGIKRANALLSSIVINDKRELLINTEQYEVLVREPMGRHESELEKDYRNKRASLYSVLEQEKVQYTKALQQTTDGTEREIIQAGLNEINTRMAMKIFNDGLIEFKKTADNKGEIQINKKSAIVDDAALENYHEALVKAFKLFPDSKSEGAVKVKAALLQLAASYKQLATKLFVKHKLPEAKKFYEETIKIYTTYFPGLYLDEIAKVYSNLSLIMNKRQNFDEAIKYADKALDSLSQGQAGQMPDKEKLEAKANSNKCLAMFDKVSLLLEKKGDNLEKIKSEFKNATILYEKIKDSKHLDKKVVENLAQKFTTLNQALTPESISSKTARWTKE